MTPEIPQTYEITLSFGVLYDVGNTPDLLESVEFEDEPPSMFVLCGNFCSSPASRAENVELLKIGFDKLAEEINSFPKISAHSIFIIVPGLFTFFEFFNLF